MATGTMGAPPREIAPKTNKPPFRVPPISYFVAGVPLVYFAYAIVRWFKPGLAGHGYHVLYASVSAAICLAAYFYGVGRLSPHAPSPPPPDETQSRSRLRQAFSLPRQAASNPLGPSVHKPDEINKGTSPAAKP